MNQLFKALDDPTRRDILDLLKAGEKTAGEIAEHFAMSKPSISYHLDLLRQAELVVSEKRGQFVHYTLNTSVLEETVSWMLELAGKARGASGASQTSAARTVQALKGKAVVR